MLVSGFLNCVTKPRTVCELEGNSELCRVCGIDWDICLPIPAATEYPFFQTPGSESSLDPNEIDSYKTDEASAQAAGYPVYRHP